MRALATGIRMPRLGYLERLSCVRSRPECSQPLPAFVRRSRTEHPSPIPGLSAFLESILKLGRGPMAGAHLHQFLGEGVYEAGLKIVDGEESFRALALIVP